MQVNTCPEPNWEEIYQQHRGPEPTIDEAKAVAGPEDILPDGGQDGESDHDPLYVGDHVQNVTDDDDEKTMVVVEVTTHQANEYRLEGTNKTVADVNPEFDETDDVVEVVYPDRTTKTIDSLESYAFPRRRLTRVAAVHDVGDEQ